MCSGRIFYDLAEARDKRRRPDVAIVRLEQLYPFPDRQIAAVLQRFERAAQLFWVQDEPNNMGAWFFVGPRLQQIAGTRLPLTYVGRVESASPATGSPESHKLELQMILDEAFVDG
jgi:2-oxoglutarate dehydrogenase E1 component